MKKEEECFVIMPCFLYKGKIVETIKLGKLVSTVKYLQGEVFDSANAELQTPQKCKHEGSLKSCLCKKVKSTNCKSYFCLFYE
jgi:hypothetical protein